MAVETNLLQIIYLLNQQFQLADSKPQNTTPCPKHFNLKPLILDSFVYFFVSGFLVFPILFPVIVIVRSYHPVELAVRLAYSLVFQATFISIPIMWFLKIVTAAYVLLMSYFGTTIVLLLFLWFIIMLELELT